MRRFPLDPTHIREGVGCRLRRSGRYVLINFDGGGNADFSHPWQGELNGTQMTFLPGTINKIPGTIKGVELDDPTNPSLDLSEPDLDVDGRGWVCAEVTCDPANQFGIISVEIVQVADPDTDDGKPGLGINAIGGAKPLSGNRARQPLAMLRRRADGQMDVFDQTYFNLSMVIKFAADKTPQRFFFYS